MKRLPWPMRPSPSQLRRRPSRSRGLPFASSEIIAIFAGRSVELLSLTRYCTTAAVGSAAFHTAVSPAVMVMRSGFEMDMPSLLRATTT
jgi:hypothetical protein